MRAAGMLYTITIISAILATQNFSQPKPGKAVEEEQHYRLLSIFAKNKYGYNTRFMSDFEQFLEAVLNEPFLDNSTAYYQDELTATEVEDMESGLAGEFAPADVQQLLHDVEEHDHSSYKAVRFPDRVGTNYPKGDALSCYKILPKKQ